MKRRFGQAIAMLLATVLLWLCLGCGWDSTPQYVIATPAAVTATPFARWTASPVPEGFETPTPEPTPEPTEPPEGTVAASATPTSAAQSPNASGDPSVTPTPDPYLIGTWEFKRSRYKGKEVPASETGQRMVFWLFSNGSAEMNIYSTTSGGDPPQNTQGVQWRIVGATLTMTLYGETILTLQYDGTYLILEQEVFGDTDSMIFEKTGE